MYLKFPKQYNYHQGGFDTESTQIKSELYALGISFNYETKGELKGISRNHHTIYPYVKFKIDNPNTFDYDIRNNIISFMFINVKTFFKFLDTCRENVVLWSENGANWDHHQLLKPLFDLHGDSQVLDLLNGIKSSLKGFGDDHIADTMEKFDTDRYNELLEMRYNKYFKGKKVKNSGTTVKAKWVPSEVIEDVALDKWAKMHRNEWYVQNLSPTQISTIIYINSKGKKVIFKDLALLFNTRGLANKGITITSMMKLPCGDHHETCYHKIENDDGYNVKELFPNMEAYKAYKNEYEYLIRDIAIPLQWVNLMQVDDDLPIKEWKNTTAATAHEKFTKVYCASRIAYMVEKGLLKETPNGEYYIQNKRLMKKLFLSYNWETIRNTKAISNYIMKKDFPTKGLNKLTNMSVDTDTATKTFTKENIKWESPLTQWAYQHEHMYYGGMVQINPQYKNKINKVVKIDVNSLYPTAMTLKTHEMSPYKGGIILAPIGEGITLEEYNALIPSERAKYNYYYLQFIPSETLYAQGNIPFVVQKGKQNTNEWLTVLEKGKVYHLDPYSLKAVETFYDNKKHNDDWDCTINKYLFYKTKPINDIFGNYIDIFRLKKIAAKKNFDEGAKLVAKLMLNGEYGKWCQKPMRHTKAFVDGEWIPYETYGLVNKYLPLGSLITNLSRLFMVYFMKHDWADYGIYMDTDSLAIKSEWRTIGNNEAYLQANIDAKEFGKFEIEHEEAYIIAVEAKRYCIYDATNPYSSWEITCAGLRQAEDKSQEDFISFIEGFQNIQLQKIRNDDCTVRLEEVTKDFTPTYDHDPIKNDLIKKQLLIEAKSFMHKHNIPRSAKYE